MCEGRLSGDRHLTGISPGGVCRLIARIANGADKAGNTEWAIARLRATTCAARLANRSYGAAPSRMAARCGGPVSSVPAADLRGLARQRQNHDERRRPCGAFRRYSENSARSGRRTIVQTSGAWVSGQERVGHNLPPCHSSRRGRRGGRLPPPGRRRSKPQAEGTATMDKNTTTGAGDDFALGHPPEAVPKPSRSGQGVPRPGPDRAGQVRQPTEAGFQCRPAVRPHRPSEPVWRGGVFCVARRNVAHAEIAKRR